MPSTKVLSVILLAAAVLAGSTPEAEAGRFIATRAACRDACAGSFYMVLCRALSRRDSAAGARCRTRVIRTCRRFGPAATCQPPDDTTTTTTPPVATTSTTVQPFVPTTTTTLPSVVNNPALPFAGTWSFYGTLSEDTCPETFPAAGTEQVTVAVIPSSPGAAVGQAASAPGITFSGGVTTSGDLTLEALVSNQNGCTIDTALLLDGPISVSTRSTGGGIGFDASCPVYVSPCRLVYTGTWRR